MKTLNDPAASDIQTAVIVAGVVTIGKASAAYKGIRRGK